MSEQFKIEHGVPLPGPRLPKPDRYPFAEMRPGDSFVEDAEPPYKGNVASTAHAWAKKHWGAKFTTCCREENGRRVVRVWMLSAPAGNQNPEAKK